MSTDMENDTRQKLVEKSQVDLFYKSADILASVYQTFKAVENQLLRQVILTLKVNILLLDQ